jgi:hypothetical protein
MIGVVEHGGKHAAAPLPAVILFLDQGQGIAVPILPLEVHVFRPGPIDMRADLFDPVEIGVHAVAFSNGR